MTDPPVLVYKSLAASRMAPISLLLFSSAVGAARFNVSVMTTAAETPTDPITGHIIWMFWVTHRARRYLTGASGAIALHLSVAEINQVVNAYGSPVARFELDACIFALDSEYLTLA